MTYRTAISSRDHKISRMVKNKIFCYIVNLLYLLRNTRDYCYNMFQTFAVELTNEIHIGVFAL